MEGYNRVMELVDLLGMETVFLELTLWLSDSDLLSIAEYLEKTTEL